MADDNFHYDPLERPAEQVRLLRFSNAEAEDDSLRLELTTWNLEDAPAYRAISYTWGPHETRELYVNGYPFQVRTNCYYTLTQVRARYPHGYIWLDSISIDQSDDEEKSYQVAMMKDIYVRASFVLISIGPHEAGSEIVVRTAADMEKAVREASKKQGEDIDDPDVNLIGPIYRKDWIQCAGSLSREEASNLRQALIEFLERAYWHRLWIVQEVAAAGRALEVLCGSDSVSWLGVYLLLELTDVGRSSYAPTNLWNDIEYNLRYRPVAASSLWYSARLGSLDLDTALTLGDEQECADPRDRVYGLLGLIDWDNEDPIRPDYSQDVLQLAIKVTTRLGELRRVPSMLQSLRIFSDGTEMRSLCEKALQETRSPAEHNYLGHARFGGVRVSNIAHDNHTSGLRLESTMVDLNGDLMPLQMKMLLQQHQSTRPHSMVKFLTFKNNIAGLVCYEAEKDHILAYPKVPRTFNGTCLVLRPLDSNFFDVVGQGFVFDSDLWTKLASTESVFKDADGNSSIHVNMTPEDAVLFAGRDLIDSDEWTDYDMAARFRRLAFKPVTFPKAAAYVKKYRADAWDNDEKRFDPLVS